MTETLILGNGISRLAYVDLIRDWPGEVWGCNRAYLDHGDKLTRLCGHDDVMIEARQYRDDQGLSYEIWGGHIGGGSATEKAFTCPPGFRKDSGTTLVAQALHEGRAIALCGFDLGGPDIHSPGLEKQLKHNWIDRWRNIVKTYGDENIRFIGFDHLWFINSNLSALEYSRKYAAGRPHIFDDEYLKVWEKWAGKPPFVTGDEYMKVQVKYKDGRLAQMDAEIAHKMQAKGKVEIVKEKKAEAPKVEAEKPKAQKKASA